MYADMLLSMSHLLALSVCMLPVHACSEVFHLEHGNL